MKWLQKILVLFLLLFLISCSMATPNIRLNAGGVEMELIQPVPIPMIAPGNITSDGKYFLTAGWKEQAFKLWDISTGTQINKFNTESAALCHIYAVSSPNGKYALSTGKNLKLWDLSSGKEIKTLDDSNTSHISPFSSDGSKVASLTMKRGLNHVDFNISLWDAVTWNKITRFKVPYDAGFPENLALSPDGRYILLGCRPHKLLSTAKGKMVLMDAVTGEVLKTVIASEGSMSAFVFSVAFSPDGKQALSAGMDNTVRLWDIPSGTEIKRIKAHSSKGIIQRGAFFVTFSPNSKYFLSGGGDGLLKLWDVSTGAEIRSFGGFSGSTSIGITHAVGYAAFLPDGKHIVSAAADGAVRIWDISSGEEIALFFGFEDGEWLVITSEGYYNASEKGAQYLSVKVSGKEYTIEQLRESFYRPDLVKVALSGGSLKELKKVADVKPPPVVAIVDTPKSIDKSDSSINLKITDAGGGIGDIRLYLNGSAVMLDSAKGEKIAASEQNEIYKSYQLKLSPGLNLIRAIAFNADNTMQSTDAIHEIIASYKSIGKPSLYALVIGINEYKNPKLQLNYAVADAALFANTLMKGASPLFEKVVIKKLSSKEETTRENILKELKTMQALNPDDLFVFYVASHGTVDDGEYFLITSNVGSTRTERLKTDAIGQKVFKELISNIPATKKLIIIDTCNAGALGEVIQMALLTRGMSEDTAMKILSRAVGSTILSASTSMQEALEGYQGHGLFTYVLAEGLNGKADKGNTGYVKTTELADYVDSEVPPLAEKIFKKAQYPTISISGQAFPIGKVR